MTMHTLTWWRSTVTLILLRRLASKALPIGGWPSPVLETSVKCVLSIPLSTPVRASVTESRFPAR